jgi:RNA polymerase sigma-70 factor (ECF subfamily)
MNLLAATRATVKSLPAEADDRDLAARLARGDERAFEQIVERYGPRIIALAARLLDWSDGADDVAQDVFLAVLRKGKQFRGESRLWTWLAAMTVNRCRSLRRRRWLKGRVLRVIARVRAKETEPADRTSERDETAASIRAAVARLPATSREVIVLRYFEGLSIDEVAQVLSLRRNTVEARLSRARKQLEKSLHENL